MMLRPSYAQVSAEALKSNYKILRSMTEHAFFCPMIKADAYGHGDIMTAKLLMSLGVSAFGVALVEEGIRLREAGIENCDILVFSPLHEGSLEQMRFHRLTPVICAQSDVKMLKHNPQKGLKVHVKVNTGMNRLGLVASDCLNWVRELEGAGCDVTGVCTHLAAGENVERPQNSSARLQLLVFDNVIEKLGRSVVAHALNSDALLGLAKISDDLRHRYGARPGIALYGLAEPRNAQLKPALALRSRIVHTQNVRRGQGVSYGPTWTAARDSVIGIIPLGYADGVRRSLSNQLRVFVGEKLCPAVGNICMDYFMVDVTEPHQQSVNLEDAVITVLGDQANASAFDWAKQLGTNTYEILTGISRRVPRVMQ